MAWAVAFTPLPLFAQDNPADCTRIDDDQARLTCYDRAHKREPVPAGVNPPSPPASAPVALRNTEASMFDDRWDLDGRRKGELFYPRAYKPVYLLPITWTDSVNTMPTSPAPNHSVTTPTDLDSVEFKYQLSLKAKLWEDLFGSPAEAVGRLHAIVTLAGLQRCAVAAVSRDQLRARADRRVAAGLHAARLAPAPVVAGAEPPIQRPRAAAVAQLEPRHRRSRVRSRRLDGAAATRGRA